MEVGRSTTVMSMGRMSVCMRLSKRVVWSNVCCDPWSFCLYRRGRVACCLWFCTYLTLCLVFCWFRLVLRPRFVWGIYALLHGFGLSEAHL